MADPGRAPPLLVPEIATFVDPTVIAGPSGTVHDGVGTARVPPLLLPQITTFADPEVILRPSGAVHDAAWLIETRLVATPLVLLLDATTNRFVRRIAAIHGAPVDEAVAGRDTQRFYPYAGVPELTVHAASSASDPGAAIARPPLVEVDRLRIDAVAPHVDEPVFTVTATVKAPRAAWTIIAYHRALRATARPPTEDQLDGVEGPVSPAPHVRRSLAEARGVQATFVEHGVRRTPCLLRVDGEALELVMTGPAAELRIAGRAMTISGLIRGRDGRGHGLAQLWWLEALAEGRALEVRSGATVLLAVTQQSGTRAISIDGWVVFDLRSRRVTVSATETTSG